MLRPLRASPFHAPGFVLRLAALPAAVPCRDTLQKNAEIAFAPRPECRAGQIGYLRFSAVRVDFGCIFVIFDMPKIFVNRFGNCRQNSTVIFVSPAAATVSPHVRKCSLYVGSFILSNSFFIFAETLFLFRRHAGSGACPAGRRRGAAGQRDDGVGYWPTKFFRREILDFRKLWNIFATPKLTGSGVYCCMAHK